MAFPSHISTFEMSSINNILNLTIQPDMDDIHDIDMDDENWIDIEDEDWDQSLNIAIIHNNTNNVVNDDDMNDDIWLNASNQLFEFHPINNGMFVFYPEKENMEEP